LLTRLLSGDPDALFQLLVFGLAWMISLPFHESAHAWMAAKLGDQTGRVQGRITMNPLAHIDPMGLICMLVAGIGWAKPVPVNPRNFNRNISMKAGMALTSLAGPVSNLILAVALTILAKLCIYAQWAFSLPEMVYTVGTVIYTIASVNVVLAVFNMIPVPPFDGSRVLFYFLPQRIYFGVMKYERILMAVMMAVILLGVLDVPLNFIETHVMWFVDLITGFVGLPFGLGWY